MSSPNDTTHLNDPQDSSSNDLEISLSHWENYKIQSLLGEGGMARVYKAYDPKLNRYVALKFIRSDNENLKKRLLREAKAQAQIEQDNVCKIYEVGEVEGKPYIAMQLIQGVTLQEVVQEMSIEQKVLLMQQISEAVHGAHRMGIIHRDIKPSNIMVERKEGGSFRPFIMDFGIAREISDPGMTATDVVVGTPSYMAPEQLTGGHQSIDRRTDVYGLGATMYHIFSGEPPFKGTGMEIFLKLSYEDPIPLSKAMPSIPADLDVIISKCLEKEPTRRYESARALSEDLKRFLDGEPIVAQRTSFRYKLIKKIRKNKTVATVLGVAAFIILISAAFSIASYLRARSQVQIARQFSQYAESMDWLMRVAYMSPLHDVRKEKAQVTKQMQEIERKMNVSGDAAIGPGNFALGRGHLTLQNYDKARIHLEKAWKSGYRDKEVASALGLALGSLYKRKLIEVDRISDAETRKLQLQTIENEYRDPAAKYLRAGSETANQSGEYGEALLFYYEKDWDNALRLARNSIEKFPWLYEAKMLEGDVFFRLGEQAFQEGKFDLAREHLYAAAKRYAEAEQMARSDPAVYENQCSVWGSVMEVEFGTGQDGKKEFERSNNHCKTALVANNDNATAYELLARTTFRWGENQWVVGEDPTPAWKDSIEMSRKAQMLIPDKGNPYYLMGTCYGYLADYEIGKGIDPAESLNQSIKALLIAVEKDPASAPTFTNLGVSYFSQGTLAMERGQESKGYFEKAIQAYQKALQLSPKYLAARSNIANAFMSLGKDAMIKGTDPTQYFQQSIENYKKALLINPNHWLIHNNLSTVYAQQIRYGLDHGKDITSYFENALRENEISERLKESNWYSVINTSEDYVYRAEYALQVNEDPSPWLKKAEDTIYPALDKLDWVEPYLALGEAKKIEAEYLLRKNSSPLSSLQEANKHFDRAHKINPKEHVIPLGRARLELIKASWLRLNKQSDEAAMNTAEIELEKTLELNPRSSHAYALLAEVNLRKSEWKNSRNENASGPVEKGLAYAEKSIKLKPDLAEAYSIKGKLLVLAARMKFDQKDCLSMAEESIKNFKNAFQINPNLQNQETDIFKKMKVVCASTST